MLSALAALTAAPPGTPAIDFSRPHGAPALFAPDSVTWRVMKNPIALLVGGVAAVILELAEPRVRAGVWGHTSFQREPALRVRRTGYAAWVTVYGAAADARRMIAGVNSAHARVRGVTPEGLAYRADDRALLDWVQATASFGFVEAYRTYARPLSAEAVDRFYAESPAGAALYGAVGAPRAQAEMHAMLERMAPQLESSPIVFAFLDLMRTATLLPAPLRPLQLLAVDAAIDLVPRPLAAHLGLGEAPRLNALSRTILRTAGAASERVALRHAPPAQACLRLGLRADFLYRGAALP